MFFCRREGKGREGTEGCGWVPGWGNGVPSGGAGRRARRWRPSVGGGTGYDGQEVVYGLLGRFSMSRIGMISRHELEDVHWAGGCFGVYCGEMPI